MPSSKIYYSLCYLSYMCFFVVAQPIGVDWPAYSSLNVDFSRVYFAREPLGWILPALTGGLEHGNLFAACFVATLLNFGTIFCLNATGRLRFGILMPVLLILLLSNFYLLMSVNGIRQGMSFGFFLFSFGWLRMGNLKYALISFVLAVLSHNAILVLFPVLFSYRYQGSWITNLGLVALLALGSQIAEVSGKSSLDSVTDNTLVFFIVIGISFVCIIFLNLLKRRVDSRDVHAAIATFIIALTFVQISSAFDRLAYYLVPLMIIILVNQLRFVSNRRVVTGSLLLVSIVTVIYNISHPSVTNNFVNL